MPMPFSAVECSIFTCCRTTQHTKHVSVCINWLCTQMTTMQQQDGSAAAQCKSRNSNVGTCKEIRPHRPTINTPRLPGTHTSPAKQEKRVLYCPLHPKPQNNRILHAFSVFHLEVMNHSSPTTGKHTGSYLKEHIHTNICFVLLPTKRKALGSVEMISWSKHTYAPCKPVSSLSVFLHLPGLWCQYLLTFPTLACDRL